jgi:2-hydroxychromene-2-carboxylate isomerase
MAAPIDFWFDFSSPYGYLASTRIDELAARHGRTARWRPFLLGVVFKVSGQAPLLDIPLKGEYSRHDMPRFARLWNVPLSFPPVFPFSAVAPSRAFHWLEARDPALAARFAKAAYAAAWAGGRDLARADVVADVAASLGVQREDALAGMVDPAVKEKLRLEVDAAVKAGIFGSPTIVVDGEKFWGADRLWQVEEWLKRGGW